MSLRRIGFLLALVVGLAGCEEGPDDGRRGFPVTVVNELSTAEFTLAFDVSHELEGKLMAGQVLESVRIASGTWLTVEDAVWAGPGDQLTLTLSSVDDRGTRGWGGVTGVIPEGAVGVTLTTYFNTTIEAAVLRTEWDLPEEAEQPEAP